MHKVEMVKKENGELPVEQEQEIVVPETKEKGFVESKIEQMANLPDRYFEKNPLSSSLEEDKIRFEREQESDRTMLERIAPKKTEEE